MKQKRVGGRVVMLAVMAFAVELLHAPFIVAVIALESKSVYHNDYWKVFGGSYKWRKATDDRSLYAIILGNG
jgi:hypothetical protein